VGKEAEAMNIAQNLERAVQHFPDRPAIIFEGETLTYADLQRSVDRLAHGLTGLGVGVGDRVALFLPNIPAFANAYLATQKVGAIAVSVNTMLTTEELHHVLSDSGAGTIFTTADLLPRLKPLVGTDVRRERVVLAEGSAPGYRLLSEMGHENSDPFPAREMDRDDPAAILYTSGTTGKQKGAVLSHGNVVSNMYATSHLLRIDPDDRLLLFLPLFHCFGQNFIMNTAFTSGATLIVHRRFVPQDVLHSIAAHGATMFFGVPTIYIGLLNADVSPEALGSIRYYFSAAATMPVEIAHRWEERFGRAIHEGYGLTETSPFASYNHEWHHRPGSVGTPIEMVEITVVDADGREVGQGEWGEILIKGPNVMLGYWNRPEESAEALRGGWFHTGDIGYRDDDGYLFLVDRVKDMINAGGFKIWPREVEEVLYQHPAVKECAVVGMADPIKGEVARAVIVLHTDAGTTAEALDAYCREHLAVYKVPESIEFSNELPKSATGKILKRVLREQGAATAS
jgi:long-chain acyl-CoA synthetase